MLFSSVTCEDQFSDKSQILDEPRRISRDDFIAMRRAAFGAVVIGFFATFICVVSLPGIYFRIQEVHSMLEDELQYCKASFFIFVWFACSFVSCWESRFVPFFTLSYVFSCFCAWVDIVLFDLMGHGKMM